MRLPAMKSASAGQPRTPNFNMSQKGAQQLTDFVPAGFGGKQ